MANSKIKLFTYGQLYIYSNLAFAQRLIKLMVRFTNELNRNYYRVIDNSPIHIRRKIDKGSFYMKVLN